MLDLRGLYESITVRSGTTFRHTEDWSKIMWECSLTDWVGTITVWSNGCCDFDWLFLNSANGAFAHQEFSTLEEAAVVLTGELNNIVAGLRFSKCEQFTIASTR